MGCTQSVQNKQLGASCNNAKLGSYEYADPHYPKCDPGVPLIDIGAFGTKIDLRRQICEGCGVSVANVASEKPKYVDTVWGPTDNRLSSPIPDQWLHHTNSRLKTNAKDFLVKPSWSYYGTDIASLRVYRSTGSGATLPSKRPNSGRRHHDASLYNPDVLSHFSHAPPDPGCLQNPEKNPGESILAKGGGSSPLSCGIEPHLRGGVEIAPSSLRAARAFICVHCGLAHPNRYGVEAIGPPHGPLPELPCEMDSGEAVRRWVRIAEEKLSGRSEVSVESLGDLVISGVPWREVDSRSHRAYKGAHRVWKWLSEME